MTTMMGTATHTSQLNPASSRSAMTTPPTAMMGAMTNRLSDISVTICNCCTSLVARVINVAGPNCDIWYDENRETRRNIAARRSRPMDIADRAANHTDAIAEASWANATA